MAENKYVDATKKRIETIRLRTWTLTLAIIVALVFYFLVTVSLRQTINPVDFVFLCAVQIVVHSSYFPDGEIFGQKDGAFIGNKTAYNEKATEINQSKRINRLREYCKIEFEERKAHYIANECGIIGISIDELEQLKKFDEKTIGEMKTFEFTDDAGSKVIYLSKQKRKKLAKLLFKRIPIEENNADTIMSAVENNGMGAIKDESISYKAHSYIRKIMLAVVIGAIFAYVGYTARQGIGLAEITSIIMYLTTFFTTAVMAYSQGEKCSKVYKSHFYVDLVNFIDGFNEWEKGN